MAPPTQDFFPGVGPTLLTFLNSKANTNELRLELLLTCRACAGKSEDHWENPEVSKILREVLEERWPELISGAYDPSQIRTWATGKRKSAVASDKADFGKVRASLESALKHFSGYRKRNPTSHSVEYLETLLSQRWLKLRAQYLIEVGSRCEGCGIKIGNQNWELHHTPNGYGHLGTERYVDVMALCHDCHPVLDMLREQGGQE